MAAPSTPMPKQKMKTGSRAVFTAAPRIMETMAYLGLPSARIMAFRAAGIIRKGRLKPMILP